MNSYITSVRGNMGIGRAISLCSGLFNLARLSALYGGFIADRFGFKIIYSFAGVLFLISTIIIFLTSKKTEPHHADQVSTQPRA
jgi:MFS family permease